MGRPRVGIFDLTSCNGCMVEIINIESLLELLGKIDLINFRLVKDENIDGPFDISFIEGYPSNDEEVEKTGDIREDSNCVVALGSCACFGGLPSIRNYSNLEDANHTVYGIGSPFKIDEVKPLDAYIDVDYYLHGCPINQNEFIDLVSSLLIGRPPETPNFSVCFECKQNENICLMKEGTSICLGPITRGGCDALCPSFGRACEGCRGPVDQANISSEIELLKKFDLSLEDIIKRFRKYSTVSEPFKRIKIVEEIHVED